MPSLSAQAFFETMTRNGDALTFDDIQVETGFADFAPGEISIEGRLSRNVPLLVPIVGAAMSSVVHAPMAIALAKFGGIGSLPRSFTPDEQAKQAARVKNNIHGFTDNPITISEHDTVAEVLTLRKEKGWDFDSFPVLNRCGKFVGLMTHSDFKWCDDTSAAVGAVMTVLKQLLIADTLLSKEQAYQMLKQHRKTVLPVVSKKGKLLGIYTFADLKRMLSEKAVHNVDTQGRLRVCAAIGVGDEAMLRAELLAAKNVDVLHIDMAHGHQQIVLDTVRRLKEKYKRNGPDIVVGNISNRDAASALLAAGVDGILVGQGGGAICTTRRVTGIGKPQVSAVWECVAELRRDFSGVPVCSDGGIRGSGDILKALAVGAHSVMVGQVLAGTDEAPGEKRLVNGRLVKDFYGMGSIRAMMESESSRQRYSHFGDALIAEGVEAAVPYKGPVADVLVQQAGGLKKGMLNCGVRTLAQLRDKAKFFRVSVAGLVESHPHDVTIVAEAPNYSS